MNDTTSHPNQNELESALEKCRLERQDYLTGWQRARADFLNYKKDQGRVMDEFRNFAHAQLLEKILSVFDNLSRACDSLPESLKDDVWAKGVINVRRQFESLLFEQGIEEIKITTGDKFDPAYHEAIGEIEGEGQSGAVAEISQKGYILHGTVIRPARVKIIK